MSSTTIERAAVAAITKQLLAETVDPEKLRELGNNLLDQLDHVQKEREQADREVRNLGDEVESMRRQMDQRADRQADLAREVEDVHHALHDRFPARLCTEPLCRAAAAELPNP